MLHACTVHVFCIWNSFGNCFTFSHINEKIAKYFTGSIEIVGSFKGTYISQNYLKRHAEAPKSTMVNNPRIPTFCDENSRWFQVNDRKYYTPKLPGPNRKGSPSSRTIFQGRPVKTRNAYSSAPSWLHVWPPNKPRRRDGHSGKRRLWGKVGYITPLKINQHYQSSIIILIWKD